MLAVPSQTLRANLEDWASVIAPDSIIVSLMKGVELGTLKRMSEVIAEITGAGPDRIAVVSGPNLSKEIARREPAASVVACADENVAKLVQDRVHGSMFRPYTSVDVVGCEIGGAYKNVVGIAVGMAVGLGFGDNTTASLITRGLAETARVAKAFDANPMTLMGLAGLGDLVATCSSPLSRNRSFGEKLGKGMTTDEIYASTRQVAEGAKSCASLHALARREGVYVPIAEAVDAVVAGKMTAADTMESFISRRHQGRDRLNLPSPLRFEAWPARLRHRDLAPSARPFAPSLRRLQVAIAATGRSAATCRGPAARSAQRSSTSSMPTDIRTSPSGMVAASVFQRRRRSNVDSTLPSEVACTHSDVEWVSRSARSAPVDARSRRSRRSRGSAPPRPRGAPRGGARARSALACARSTRRCRVRRPRSASQASNVPGIAPTRSRRPLRTSYSWSSRTTSAPITTSLWPARNLVTECSTMSAPSSSGCWSSGVAKVLSTTTRAPASWPAADEALDVGDLEGRVGRRLDPEDGRVVERRDHRVGVGDVDERRLDPATGLEVAELADAAEVGVPRRDDQRVLARRGRAPWRQAASPEEKASARPPSSAPSASSKACQVGLA